MNEPTLNADTGTQNRDRRELFDRKWVRWLLFILIPAAIFILLVSGIHVSRLSIDHTIVIFGQKHLVPGTPAALRITLIDDTEGFFLPDRVGAVLVRGQKRFPLFDRPASGAGYATGFGFTVPNIAPGPAVIEFSVQFDKGRRIARAPVILGPVQDNERLIVPSDVDLKLPPLPITHNGTVVHAFTEDRGIFSGLTSLLFLRTTDLSGAPRKETLRLLLPPRKSGEAPTSLDIQTDAAGLFAIPIKSFDTQYALKIDGALDKNQALIVPVVYGGIGVALKKPIVEEGELLEFRTSRITSGDPVYADIYNRGQWVAAASAWSDEEGQAVFRMRVPGKGGLYRLQLTNSPLGTGRTVAVRHFFVLPEGTLSRTAIDETLGHLSDADRQWFEKLRPQIPKDSLATVKEDQFCAYFLSRLYRGHAEPDRLVTSRREDDAELEAYKTRFQHGVLIILALLATALAVFILLIARSTARRDARLNAMILEEDSAAPPPASNGPEPRFSARTSLIPALLLLVVIIATILSLGLLLMTLSW